MTSTLLWYLVILFAVPFAIGSVTLFRRWSEDLLHLFLSFGAGVFLGAVFLHLLPETMSRYGGEQTAPSILYGFLLIFFVERFLVSREGGSNGSGHQVISLTAFFGLSLHSLLEGVGLAVTSKVTGLELVLFISILAHKIPAAFALGSLMALSRLRRSTTFVLLAVFAAMTPLGGLLVGGLFGEVSTRLLGGLTGLVTGSFLYVATLDLLPEVFHSPRRRWLHLVLMLSGIAVMGMTRVWLHP